MKTEIVDILHRNGVLARADTLDFYRLLQGLDEEILGAVKEHLESMETSQQRALSSRTIRSRYAPNDRTPPYDRLLEWVATDVLALKQVP